VRNHLHDTALNTERTKEEEAQRMREGSFVARCHPDQNLPAKNNG
jgi:hypothetical protein